MPGGRWSAERGFDVSRVFVWTKVWTARAGDRPACHDQGQHCAATVHSAQKLKYIHLVDIVLFVNYSKIFSTARVACKLTERVLQIGCSHHQSSIMKLDFVMDFNMVTPHSVPPPDMLPPPHICYRARLTSVLEWS